MTTTTAIVATITFFIGAIGLALIFPWVIFVYAILGAIFWIAYKS